MKHFVRDVHSRSTRAGTRRLNGLGATHSDGGYISPIQLLLFKELYACFCEGGRHLTDYLATYTAVGYLTVRKVWKALRSNSFLNYYLISFFINMHLLFKTNLA